MISRERIRQRERERGSERENFFQRSPLVMTEKHIRYGHAYLLFKGEWGFILFQLDGEYVDGCGTKRRRFQKV